MATYMIFSVIYVHQHAHLFIETFASFNRHW